MTNRKCVVLVSGLRAFALLGIGAGLLSGCSKEEQKAPAPIKQTYTAPEPEVGPLDEIDLDSRVEFPEDRAPQNREAAVAVAGLASAIASGDSDGLGVWLSPGFMPVLSDLVDDGSWNSSTGEIEVVRVCSLDHDEDHMRLALGIQDSEGAYLLGWDGSLKGTRWRFEPIAIESQYAMAASDLDDAPLIGPMIAETAFEVAPEPVEEKEEAKKKASGKRRGGGLR